MDSENHNPHPEHPVAIVALTRQGVGLALQLRAKLPGSVCYVPRRHQFALAMGAKGFDRLGGVFPQIWVSHRALVCIMATGIVVRQIARLLHHKTTDPAVVVLDERGRFVISLLSGHLGGANQLALEIARMIGGQPVITTASDVQNKPALDLIAVDAALEVENRQMLSRLSRALVEEEPLWVFDPEGRLRPYIGEEPNVVFGESGQDGVSLEIMESRPGIWVCERSVPDLPECLILRPQNLVMGIGCNRGTETEEILGFIREVFLRGGISLLSIRNLASIDVKADEQGILDAARALNRPVHFYMSKELEPLIVPNPSEVVARHIGVQSVCEAAALLSAQSRTLLVQKQKSPNVTLAVAKVNFPS